MRICKNLAQKLKLRFSLQFAQFLTAERRRS